MIYLTKGQELKSNPGIVVYGSTGYYDDGDSVVCAMAHSPEEPVCRFEAKFIAYGDAVYVITDETKLMEEVKSIDPETLFGKNSAEVAVDKVVEKIEKEVEDIPTENNEELEEDSEPAPESEAVPEENPETPTEETPESEVVPEPEPTLESEAVPEENPETPTEETPEPEPAPEPEAVTEEVVPLVPPSPETPVTEETVSVLTRKRKRRIT